jgi:two-component system, NarL family, nitrate/nitrite response regulator NarL
MKSKIKVLLVDDHPFVIEGIRSHLNTLEQFEVAGEAASGEEALQKCEALAPHIVVMDISMPGMDGVQATRALQQQFPAVKILILTMHDKREFILEIMHSGANGYVLKNTSPAELVQAIETVSRGESYFSQDVPRMLLQPPAPSPHLGPFGGSSHLTPRETQVLSFIMEGLYNKEVASRLGLSVRTVEKHRERIMAKLNVHNVVELMKLTMSEGFLEQPKETTRLNA